MEIFVILALLNLILAKAAVIFNQRLVLINEKTPRYFFSLDGRYSVRLTHRPLLLLWGDIQNIYFEDKFLGKVTNLPSFQLNLLNLINYLRSCYDTVNNTCQYGDHHQLGFFKKKFLKSRL